MPLFVAVPARSGQRASWPLPPPPRSSRAAPCPRWGRCSPCWCASVPGTEIPDAGLCSAC